MITFPTLPGVEINIFLLIFIGLAVGVLSGFMGVGGGFLMAPTLIILGLPANFAVGTSLAWITGGAIIGTLRHRQLGNVDMRLGVLMIAGTISGVEIGVLLSNSAKSAGLTDVAVLATYIVILTGTGLFTFWETTKSKAQLDRKARGKGQLSREVKSSSISQKVQRINIPPMINLTKSRLTISLWTVLAVGLFVGMLAGFMGAGGGFIMVPSLVYLIGLPSFMAVGTDIFQIIFSASYGTIRHTMSGNVIILAAIILLLGSSVGIHFGALITRYVRGVSVRYILAFSILLSVIGSALKLLDILLRKSVTWLETGTIAVVFGGMGLIVVMIIVLFVMAMLYRSDRHIPAWFEPLVTKGE